jgi:hypothetical protein
VRIRIGPAEGNTIDLAAMVEYKNNLESL